MTGGGVDNGTKFAIGDTDSRIASTDKGVDVSGGNGQSIAAFGDGEPAGNGCEFGDLGIDNGAAEHRIHVRLSKCQLHRVKTGHGDRFIHGTARCVDTGRKAAFKDDAGDVDQFHIALGIESIGVFRLALVEHTSKPPVADLHADIISLVVGPAIAAKESADVLRSDA